MQPISPQNEGHGEFGDDDAVDKVPPWASSNGQGRDAVGGQDLRPVSTYYVQGLVKHLRLNSPPPDCICADESEVRPRIEKNIDVAASGDKDIT